MANRRPGQGSKARFVFASMLGHALLLTFAATREDERAASPPPVAAGLAPIEIDVVPPAANPEEPNSVSPLPLRAGSLGPATATAPARPAAVATPDAATSSAEPESDGTDPSGQSPAAAAPAAPRLGLAELGVTGPNPFLDPALTSPKPAEDRRAKVKKRLDRALAQGLQDRDTALGLGAGSPVMRALEAAAYASTAPLNGNAHFVFVIDSEGKLLSANVGAVSSDREKWQRVAHRAAQSLTQRKLRVPKGKSVRLTIAVTSHLELPSGRDPGLALSAFGVPLKKGQGERSTRIDILNPQQPGVPLLLDGDPADIGATARRMVRSHVVSEELL